MDDAIALDGMQPALGRLLDELRAAGIPAAALLVEGDLLTMLGADQRPVAPTPEAEAVVAAHDPTAGPRTAAFEAAEDAERLGTIAERAATDPAYAALADIVLVGRGQHPLAGRRP